VKERAKAATKLAGRVFASLLAVSVVSASLATMASAYLHQSTMMDEALVELGHECEVLASTLDASDGEVDELASSDLGEMRATLVTPQGEVLYDSRHAPRMREWKGYVRPDFDYLAYFITTAHALGMKVHALRHLSSHRLSRPLAFVRGGNAQCGNAEMKPLRFPQAWT
jgi:hypothetical protein